MGFFFDWLDRNFGIKKPHRQFLYRPIPEGVNYFFCLGGIAFTLFIMLFASGLMLAIYYVPSDTEAFASILHINNEGAFRMVHQIISQMVGQFIYCGDCSSYNQGFCL